MLSVSQFSLALLLVAATASTDAVPSGDYYSAMLTAVNAARAKQGVPALCMNKKLQAAAQRHSDDMAKNNYMAHDGADGSTMSQRITEAGYEWDGCAENVAAGQEEVDSVMQGWLDSPGHYENIMNRDYTMFGTAYSYNKDTTYGIYWTQDFASGETEACDGGNSSTPCKSYKCWLNKILCLFSIKSLINFNAPLQRRCDPVWQPHLTLFTVRRRMEEITGASSVYDAGLRELIREQQIG
ncbi:SCP extracellular protein [Phytophthora nicotianae]|uniref:SCP extracellular protein n=1 Tax=Phytophthora nicotianae TaxID=4792 RepID=A0A0W8C5D8_PHYNI|nr:SCP extracellular protein [Phytophthora nicotianae]